MVGNVIDDRRVFSERSRQIYGMDMNEEEKGPGTSIYPGALVAIQGGRSKYSYENPIKRFESWTWYSSNSNKVPAGGGVPYSERWVHVKPEAVGIVIDKCPNDIIKAPDRTWIVAFEAGMAIVRQADIRRVSFSWKESSLQK